jgi:hypothetical protein
LAGVEARTVVLVEGVSDLVAVSTLARLRGRDLDAAGVRVVSMGGATNVLRFLRRYGPEGADARVVGLCDVGEARFFRRALDRTGIAADPDAQDMERLGFFVCARDRLRRPPDPHVVLLPHVVMIASAAATLARPNRRAAEPMA